MIEWLTPKVPPAPPEVYAEMPSSRENQSLIMCCSAWQSSKGTANIHPHPQIALPPTVTTYLFTSTDSGSPTSLQPISRFGTPFSSHHCRLTVSYRHPRPRGRPRLWTLASVCPPCPSALLPPRLHAAL